MSIRSKILLLSLALVLSTAGVLLGLLLSVESHMKDRLAAMQANTQAMQDGLAANAREMMVTELRNLAKTCWRVCDASERRTQEGLAYNLELARTRLRSMGPLALGKARLKWQCVDQYTRKTTEIELPQMMLGNLCLCPVTGERSESPVVDFVKHATGDFCTVFQRMNETGDMLRVSTSVTKNDGTPAVGTYIPRIGPDGADNPIITTVLRGETYRGRAFVVNDWHSAIYEPIWDTEQKVIGMLYVGTSQAATLSNLREVFRNTVVGRFGYVWALGGSGSHHGVYIVSRHGERDGENVSVARDRAGRPFIREIIAAAKKTRNGDCVIDQYPWINPGESEEKTKTAAITYFEPFDWIIGVSIHEDEFAEGARHIRAAAEQAATTADNMIADIRKLVGRVVAAGVGIAILGVAAAVLFARSISTPITSLAARVRDLHIDRMDFIVAADRADEIGVLEKSFQRMVRSLQEAIARLKSDEDRLQGISDAMTDALIVHDARTGEILEVNRKMLEMFGYTREEAKKLCIEDIGANPPPPAQFEAMAWTRKAVREGPQVFEWLSRRKNGETFWTEIGLRAARIAGNDLVIATLRDLSARKQAEERLLRREQELRRQNEVLLAFMAQGTWFRADLRDAVREITEACSQLIQTRRVSVWWYENDYETIRCFDLYDSRTGQHSDGDTLRSADFPTYTDSHRRGQVIAAEDVHTDPRTREIPASYYEKHDIRSLLDAPVWLHDRMGGLLSFEHVGEKRSWSQDDERLSTTMAALLSLCFESWERRRSDEALHRSEERFRTIAESIPCAIYRCACDDQWTMEFISGHITDITGYPPTDFIHNATRSYASIIHPEDAGLLIAGLREAIEARRPWTLEYRIRHADGTLRHVYDEGQASFNESGRVSHLDGFILDITERKKAQDERLRLEAELRHAQKMEAIGTLATGIAHDFNNLLTAISGYTEMARSSIPLDHDAQQSLEIVGKAVRDAAGIANSLLTFSRKTVSGKVPIDLCAVVRDSLKLLRRIVPATIQMNADLPTDQALCVPADVGQMHQVLMNLITNAKDAMPEGGEIRVLLSAENHQLTQGAEGAAPGSVLLVVEDTGSGMSPAVMERLFDPFFTTKTRGKGTGLGMAIVHGIVQDHEGEIQVQSEPGRGTRIAIRLPSCDSAPSAPRTAEPACVTTIRRNQTVLVAEDEEYVRALIEQSFIAAGYTTVVTAGGDDALSRFRDRPDGFQAAVLDIELPEMSGWQCLREIRRLRPDLPVILITGNPEFNLNEDADECLVLLRKPFKMINLINLTEAMIASACDEQSLTEPA